MDDSYKYYGKRKRAKRRPFRFLLFLLFIAAVLYSAKQILANYHILDISIPAFGASTTATPESESDSDYTLVTMSDEDLTTGTLVLVNADHEWTAFGSVELESIFENQSPSYYVSNMNTMLRKDAITALNDMMDDFYSYSDLLTVNVVAGYRTYSDQEDLYNNSLETNGLDYTSQYIALPGCSEHHTGLAIDLSIYYSETGLSDNFDGTGEYSWFGENSWKYGYVLRYAPDKSSFTGIASEPWHYRYVGIPHAYQMYSGDMCLEEYIDYLRGYPYDGEHLEFKLDGTSYEIYTCEGNDVYVPTDAEYEISGNNDDGFIVTVMR